MILTVAPSPVPYPSPSNGIVDSWNCTDVVGPSPSPIDAIPVPTTTSVWAKTGTECAVSHYSETYPQPVTVNASTAPAPDFTPDPAGYSPGDTGNWSDMSGWFAGVLVAVVLGPFALVTFLRWFRKTLAS